jgi:hypothetical protein
MAVDQSSPRYPPGLASEIKPGKTKWIKDDRKKPNRRGRISVTSLSIEFGTIASFYLVLSSKPVDATDESLMQVIWPLLRTPSGSSSPVLPPYGPPTDDCIVSPSVMKMVN